MKQIAGEASSQGSMAEAMSKWNESEREIPTKQSFFRDV
jgi:hypothetical protein